MAKAEEKIKEKVLQLLASVAYNFRLKLTYLRFKESVNSNRRKRRQERKKTKERS